MVKLNSQDLAKLRPKNLSKFKKVQSTGTSRKSNFLTPDAKILFIKLR